MIGIPIYAQNATDFSSGGLGLLTPTECTITEQAGGKYELTLVQPITSDLRWTQVLNGCILKVRAPKRESPIYEMTGSGSSAVTREIYEVDTNGGRLHLRQKPTTSAKILAKYHEGTEVVKLTDAGSADGYTWIQVAVVNGGATGYMATRWLKFVRSETETAAGTQPGSGSSVKVQPSREQLFRIYSIETDSAKMQVTAKAMHIFYDLRGNLVNGDYEIENVAASTAAQYVFSHALNANDFALYASDIEGSVTGDYSYKGLIESLLDPDEGIAAQAGALLVRDNFDIFLMPDQVRDMGVTVRRRKNLKSVIVTNDASDVVTRIIPVGRNEDGDPLYLDGQIYVDSSHINDYPVPMAKKIDYSEVKVGDGEEDYESDAAARQKLRELVQEEFDSGIDLPTYGMDVDFILLGNTAEYQDYASLQAVNLYDTVTVIDEIIGLTAKVRVTGYEWDALRERYNSVTLGELQDLQNTTYGFNIANGSVSGNKLIAGSVGGEVLRNATIQYAKISVAAIQQLTAEAFNAVKANIDQLDAGSINASKIDTASLNAAVADIVTLMVGSITADNIETDQLAAVLGDFLSLYSDYAGIDFADIKDMTVDEMIFRVGVGTELFIDRLVATNAFLASATLGNLIVRGEDGNYYRISVQSDGTVITTPVELTDEEIAAGETDDGKGVVDSDVDIPAMNGGQIAGSSAVISTILTDALTAGKITAGQALIASAEIPELYTTAINAIGNSIDITANSTIQMLIGVADAIRAWYTFSENGLEVGKAGSTYSTLTDDTGFHILQLDEKIGSFAKRRLITEAVQVGPVNASGMRIVMRSAYDGGVIFVPEEVS